MAEKQGYTVAVDGPNHKFKRAIDEATANKILNLVMTGSLPGSGGDGAGAASTGLAGATQAGMGAATPGQSAKQFVTSKKPNTQYERVACLAYYLTHVANTPKFKTAAITKANTDAAGPKITNPSQIVADTTRLSGYLANAGKGAKHITALGEAVVEALPNREAVAAAIAEHKPKKKKPRSATRKKK
jgi:hypothetical protein